MNLSNAVLTAIQTGVLVFLYPLYLGAGAEDEPELAPLTVAHR